MKSLIAFIKRVVTNRIAQIFVVIHLVSIVFLYSWSQGKEITSHNFYYQPLLLKFFVEINLPSLFLTGLIFAPFIKTFPGPGQNSLWIESSYFIVLTFFSFLQWLLIGFGISKLTKR